MRPGMFERECSIENFPYTDRKRRLRSIELTALTHDREETGSLGSVASISMLDSDTREKGDSLCDAHSTPTVCGCVKNPLFGVCCYI